MQTWTTRWLAKLNTLFVFATFSFGLIVVFFFFCVCVLRYFMEYCTLLVTAPHAGCLLYKREWVFSP